MRGDVVLKRWLDSDPKWWHIVLLVWVLFTAPMLVLFFLTGEWTFLFALILFSVIGIYGLFDDRRASRRRNAQLIRDADAQLKAYLEGDDRTAYFGRFDIVGAWGPGQTPLNTEWMDTVLPGGEVPPATPPGCEPRSQPELRNGAWISPPLPVTCQNGPWRNPWDRIADTRVDA
jgi:hypothetical protein